MNPYTVLGVKPGASSDEIRSAHRKLVREHHPDAGGNVEKFRQIQEAYESIKDGAPKSEARIFNERYYSGGFDSHAGDAMRWANEFLKNNGKAGISDKDLEDLLKAGRSDSRVTDEADFANWANRFFGRKDQAASPPPKAQPTNRMEDLAHVERLRKEAKHIQEIIAKYEHNKKVAATKIQRGEFVAMLDNLPTFKEF